MAGYSPFSWTLLALVIIALIGQSNGHFKYIYKKVRKPYKIGAPQPLPARTQQVVVPNKQVTVVTATYPKPLPRVKWNPEIYDKYWAILAQRRMKAVMDCETELWEKTQSKLRSSAVTVLSSSPRRVAIRVSPCPRRKKNRAARTKRAQSQPDPLTAGVHYPMPLKREKADIKGMEIILGECTDSLAKLENRNSLQIQCQKIIQRIEREVDEVNTCKCVGGQSRSMRRTQQAVARVWRLLNRRRPAVNVRSLLRNSLRRLRIDKQTCFRSLKLPNQVRGMLEYPNCP